MQRYTAGRRFHPSKFKLLASPNVAEFARQCKGNRMFWVADAAIWLEQAGRHVDPLFQYNWRCHVDLINYLVKAGSVGFIQKAVDILVFFHETKKTRAQKFINDVRARLTFFESSVWTVAHKRTLERLRTLRSGLWVRPTCRERVSSDVLSWMVASISGTSHCCCIRSLLKGTNDRPTNVCSRLTLGFILSHGFFVGDVLVSRCHGALNARWKC